MQLDLEASPRSANLRLVKMVLAGRMIPVLQIVPCVLPIKEPMAEIRVCVRELIHIPPICLQVYFESLSSQ